MDNKEIEKQREEWEDSVLKPTLKRFGMEDSLFAGKGIIAKSSADQVEKIARIARELSINVATPDEARQILSLKGLDKVAY